MDADYSQDLMLLFSSKITEDVIYALNPKTNVVREYVYRKPAEKRLTKIQSYFYYHPRDYAYIVDMAIEPDENGKYRKMREVAKVMENMTNASNVSCENEIRSIRSIYKIAGNVRQKETKFEAFYNMNPDKLEEYINLCLEVGENREYAHRQKKITDIMVKETGFNSSTCVKEIKRIRSDPNYSKN